MYLIKKEMGGVSPPEDRPPPRIYNFLGLVYEKSAFSAFPPRGAPHPPF